MTLSLTGAARETGVSKSTIYRAVKSGKISAKRNEDDEYEIDPAELFRVFEKQADAPPRREVTRSETAQNETPGEVEAIQRQMEWLMKLAEQQREQLQESQEKWFEAMQEKDREMKERDEFWQQQLNEMKQLLLPKPEECRKKFLGIF